MEDWEDEDTDGEVHDEDAEGQMVEVVMMTTWRTMKWPKKGITVTGRIPMISVMRTRNSRSIYTGTTS